MAAARGPRKRVWGSVARPVMVCGFSVRREMVAEGSKRHVLLLTCIHSPVLHLVRLIVFCYYDFIAPMFFVGVAIVFEVCLLYFKFVIIDCCCLYYCLWGPTHAIIIICTFSLDLFSIIDSLHFLTLQTLSRQLLETYIGKEKFFKSSLVVWSWTPLITS